MTFDPAGKDDLLMKDANIIYRYIHGGKGEVTLVNATTLAAHTYRFLHPRNQSDFPEGTIFVYVLHEGRQYYLGKLRDDGTFTTTNKSSFNSDTGSVRGADYIARMSLHQDIIDRNDMLLYHSGRCCKCGRPLEDPKSVECGIGRKCKVKYDELVAGVKWDGNF